LEWEWELKLIDAKWSPRVNILIIQCDCGSVINHAADKVLIHCVLCRAYKNLHKLREEELSGENQINSSSILSNKRKD